MRKRTYGFCHYYDHPKEILGVICEFIDFISTYLCIEPSIMIDWYIPKYCEKTFTKYNDIYGYLIQGWFYPLDYFKENGCFSVVSPYPEQIEILLTTENIKQIIQNYYNKI